MNLFSELTNIYDQDLENIHDDEVYNFINRNKIKIDEVGLRIAELEEENKQLNNYNEELRQNYEKCIDFWKQENAKLQEQLKNAFCPKYKIGERKWYVEPNPYYKNELQAFDGEIYEICVDATNDDERLLYKLDTGYGLFSEDELFATEAEAQKYLEEQK